MDFAVPVTKNDQPVQLQVVFGNAQIGAARIRLSDSSKKVISEFEYSGSDLFTLPKLNFDSSSYFDIVIFGTVIGTNPATNQGTVAIRFLQGKEIIKSQTLTYELKEQGATQNFIARGKIFFNQQPKDFNSP